MSDERTPTAEPTTEAGRALLDAYDPCYCEGTVCDVLPDLAARVAAIEAEAAQRSTAEVERLREDAELGRAWRECEAALPVSYMLQIDGAEGWEAVALPFRHEWVTYKGTGDTPTEALDALRAALAEPDHDDGRLTE
jgi:hypothetical protein